MEELPTAGQSLPPLPSGLDEVCDRFEAVWKKALTGGPRPLLALRVSMANFRPGLI